MLGLTGKIDAGALVGQAGEVLLDPISVTIQNGGSTSLTELLDNQILFAEALGQALIIDPLAITNITDTGTAVTIQADLDITINNDIITNNTGGAGGDLFFEPGRPMLINADIVTDDGLLSIVAINIGADFTNRSIGGAGGIIIRRHLGKHRAGNIELTIDQAWLPDSPETWCSSP